MDNTDKQILNILQKSFSLCTRPFRQIALKLVLEESEVIERVRKLKEAGIIRRIGPVYDTRKLGYRSCLIAVKTTAENHDDIVEFISSLANVTHNYERNHEYNIWCTFTYRDDEELRRFIQTLSKVPSPPGGEGQGEGDSILILPSVKTYKLKTDFTIPSS